MIEHPVPIIKWRDAVTSARDLWSVTDAAITTDEPETHNGTLSEPEQASYQLSDLVCQAVAAFLGARVGRPRHNEVVRCQSILSRISAPAAST